MTDYTEQLKNKVKDCNNTNTIFDTRKYVLLEDAKEIITLATSKPRDFLTEEKKVYIFQYNHCIYESAYFTMSVHRTMEGAYRAMRKYIVEDYNSWREEGILYGKQTFKHAEYEAWRIVKEDLLP